MEICQRIDLHLNEISEHLVESMFHTRHIKKSCFLIETPMVLTNVHSHPVIVSRFLKTLSSLWNDLEYRSIETIVSIELIDAPYVT